MSQRLLRSLSILAIGALTACNGSSTTTITPGGLNFGAATVVVGIGDSLTAGYQSNGFNGDPAATSPLSAYPGGVVPPGQENGFFALFYEQATGTSAAAMANSGTSVLPLVRAPGLGTQVVLNATSLLAGTHSGCDAFNTAAYSSTAWTTTRLNATGAVTDLGVPGITMHEAVAMHAPLTGPPTGANCGFVTIPGDPTSGALQSLVNGESLTFYPVLGNFQNALGPNLTELNAALALKPGLVTVWLGANDLLKFTFSAGQSPASETPAQMAADLTQIVTSLKASGAKVLVADLPNVLQTPQFFPQPKISADLQALGVPAALANAIVTNFLGAPPYNIGAGGYLTESGFLTLITQLQTGQTLNLNGAAGIGSYYLPDAFAAQVAALNTAYNQAIDGVAASNGVPLVPITATFNTINATGVTLGPGQTATLRFGGGLLSWDGLHPSNLGYAVIANAFIAAADGPPYNLTIPPLTNAQIGAIAAADPYDPFVIKALNPASPFPLP